jgi:glycosyltransferase involved in cell wall biosynthesis
MQSLRIAQVMASGPVHGGLEKHFVELCNGLSTQHQVLALAHPAHGEGMREQVHFSPMDLTFSRVSPLNFLRLHRALKDFQPDVIHAHANKAASMIGALSRFFPAKTVGTVHGFKSSNRAFRHFDSVIAVSPAIHAHLDLPQARVICNGIPLTPPPPRDPQYFLRQFGLSQQRPVVVSVGRLTGVKGFDGLIQAWSGVDADLLIVGEGPDREALERRIAQLDLGDRVQLVGYRDDVPALMAHSDLVVISSEREGFPYVMVEALHLEKPIVATRFPGADQLLPAPYVVDYGQPAQLRTAIQSALSHLEQACTAYQGTWLNAKKRFTVENMVAETSAVYQQLFRAAA